MPCTMMSPIQLPFPANIFYSYVVNVVDNNFLFLFALLFYGPRFRVKLFFAVNNSPTINSGLSGRPLQDDWLLSSQCLWDRHISIKSSSHSGYMCILFSDQNFKVCHIRITDSIKSLASQHGRMSKYKKLHAYNYSQSAMCKYLPTRVISLV